MRRQFLTPFLTLLIVISIGGAVSMVGAASHVNPGQASKPTVKAQSCPYIGNARTHVYHYAGCYWASIIKPEKVVCYNSPCEAVAAHYTQCGHCNPPGC
jgi:hypothetical protein